MIGLQKTKAAARRFLAFGEDILSKKMGGARHA
jgi:hypothetical protein